MKGPERASTRAHTGRFGEVMAAFAPAAHGENSLLEGEMGVMEATERSEARGTRRANMGRHVTSGRKQGPQRAKG